MPQTNPTFLSGTSTPSRTDNRDTTLKRINGALVDILTALAPSGATTTGSWGTSIINPAAAPTAEQVGSEGGGVTTATTFRTITFFGRKSEGTDNAGDVFIRPTQNGTGVQLEPGWSVTWVAPTYQTFALGDFWVKIGSAGDGTLYAYSS